MSTTTSSRVYGYEAFGGPDTETWFERPVPAPGPSELTIAVRAVGVNPVDHKLRSGVMAGPNAQPDFPLALGVEASGAVTAVGADVDGFAVGDEVLGKSAPGHGTYAEHAVLRASDTVAKPPQLSWVTAAALPVAGGTAWESLERLHLTSGETLLINGVGGGVGVAAAQLARDRGVAVFGTASSGKRALVESLGAVLVAYDADDVVGRMRELLPGGVDAILDLVGGPSLREVAILITDPGRIVSVADPAVTELGGTMFSAGTSGLAALVDLAATDKFDPKVLQTYPFDEAGTALRSVESGHVLGKVVIDLSRSTAG